MEKADNNECMGGGGPTVAAAARSSEGTWSIAGEATHGKVALVESAGVCGHAAERPGHRMPYAMQYAPQRPPPPVCPDPPGCQSAERGGPRGRAELYHRAARRADDRRRTRRTDTAVSYRAARHTGHFRNRDAADAADRRALCGRAGRDG